MKLREEKISKENGQDCVSFENFHLLVFDIIVCHRVLLFLQHSKLHAFRFLATQLLRSMQSYIYKSITMPRHQRLS